MNNERYFKVAPGVWGMKIIFVNIYMVASNDHWVLIDAGLPGSTGRIKQMADDLFGGVAPEAILLTHGHFDHRGAVEDLQRLWHVPVYAHKMELPYLTGRSAYPPPDPTVGGGLMSLLSFLYPKKPIDLRPYIKVLDASTAPSLPEWEVIYTPGHSPGHVSFFRRSDGVLIAGDAFVTTSQESAVATLSNKPVISGPPKYFTYDWNIAHESVTKLQALTPRIAATGHGPVMTGKELKEGLKLLAEDFTTLSKPVLGRYTPLPAMVDDRGVRFVPPPRVKTLPLVLGGIAALLSIGLITGYPKIFK